MKKNLNCLPQKKSSQFYLEDDAFDKTLELYHKLLSKETPKYFKEHIAAFNTAEMAPLAPKSIQKPVTLVKKPFIPPPPLQARHLFISLF